MNYSQTTLRSKLYGKMVKFIGFCFLDHPKSEKKSLQICVYQLNKKEYVICVSELSHLPDIKRSKNGLGGMVLGDLIAPFAARGLENVEDFEFAKTEIFEKSFASTWYWAK